ncbi:hypothetical protein AOCH_000913 [Aspergillus ochraceoroseus]|uniref:Uncharacterized protein n=1 Tax=Aspergillus ochraceoroseus TaxID=138278 RepID=A0A0F8V9H9_9EURO|nr:hypothetical protein AOCH_000913 [Aspergillus ochraceoroseus]
MQSISRAMKRISFLRAKPLQLSPPVSGTSIHHCELVDEEICPGYRWQAERLVALKIINNDNPKGAYRERDIEEHIKRQKSLAPRSSGDSQLP